MKKIFLVMALIMVGLSGTGVVLADGTQGGGQFGPSRGNPQNLDNMKQRIAQRIQDHIDKLQGMLSCVQAAQDPQTLRSCLPQRMGHRRGGFGTGQQGAPG